MPVIAVSNLDIIRRALAGGAVPATVYRAAAQVGFGADGRVWILPSAVLSRNSLGALGRFGATIQSDSEVEMTETVHSWLELLALVPTGVESDDRPSPVLFDLADAVKLPNLVDSARRLGSGRVSFRWFEPSGPAAAAKRSRAFVLVESPPFHMLHGIATSAYAEQAPRVWVEVGWRHPLAEMIVPPVGQIVLIRSPRDWELVVDGAFQSGPDSYDLRPQPVVGDAAADIKLPISLRLVTASTTDLPEMWVLRDRPLERLRALAEQTDDRLLARLSVAIGAVNGSQIVVLRAQPGRSGPPILVLEALPCRTELRLPNLYVPIGFRLLPALRRDVVRHLLADDTESVTWLEPGESGKFTVQKLPESAFHPMDEVIGYVQDRTPMALTPLVVDRQFSLAPFVAREPAALPRRRPAPLTAEPPAETPKTSVEQSGLITRIVRWFTPHSGQTASTRRSNAEDAGTVDEPPRSLDTGEDQRRALEARLVAALDTPDGPERTALWPELGRLYALLNRPGDAAMCWLNALWESDDPPPQWSRGWLRAEARLARGTDTDADIRRWLAGPPSQAAVRVIAAAVAHSPPSPALVEIPHRVQRLLDGHEDWLPVRAAWLARLGLNRLIGEDPIGLARTRDRLLARLHEHGLSADLDVPTAMRFAGEGASDRAAAVRAWLTNIREPIHQWLVARSPGSAAERLMAGADPHLQAFGMGTAAAPTRAYADLIVAWGLARIGERERSQALLGQGRQALGPLDDVHRFLLDAFAARISQTLEGRPGEPLPAPLLARLAELRERDPLQAFKIDRLRQFSRVLEPFEQINAFSEAWLDPRADEPTRDMAGLRFIGDREELADQLLPLVAAAGRDAERLPQVLATALDLAPRLGEDIAGGILERLLNSVGSWSFAGPPERVEAEVSAVERGLLVAAHFDRTNAVQQLVATLGRLLEIQRRNESEESRPLEDALLALAGQGLRGLRRLGLRFEADRLLDRLGEWVAPGGDVLAEHRRRPQAWPMTLRRLLTLAGGWFYVGRDGPATEVLDEARLLLFSRELPTGDQRRRMVDLVCAYATALGQAPTRLALAGVNELFAQLPGVSDNLVTNTHFSLAKLRVVEAAVRAVVTDDFALGPSVRRWLDDDEYRVRRRIHRDTRALAG